jgi:peptidyl-prolyl cis-trans isomerase SurA
MKIKNYFFIILLTLFFDSFVLAKNTKILVKIENEIITNFDVQNKIISSLILAKKQINQENINNFKGASLENLIQNRLKKLELKKYNIKKDDKQIDLYLNSISSNNVEKMKNIFKDYDLDFKEFTDQIDVEFRWRKFIYQIYKKKINIKPEDVDREISDKLKKQKNIVEYNLSEIEILSNNTSSDLEVIALIQGEIKVAGFESAVSKFSISSTSSKSGELGWINSNSLSKEFLKILNKMQKGQVSDPIMKQDKIIFLKLNDKKTSNYTNIDFDKLKNDLLVKKQNELFELYSNSHLSKLRNTNLIQYFK